MSTGGFDIAFQHELGRNTWIMYSIGMVIIALRLSVAFSEFTKQSTDGPATHKSDEAEFKDSRKMTTS
jgi:hypothetical protein